MITNLIYTNNMNKREEKIIEELQEFLNSSTLTFVEYQECLAIMDKLKNEISYNGFNIGDKVKIKNNNFHKDEIFEVIRSEEKLIGIKNLYNENEVYDCAKELLTKINK